MDKVRWGIIGCGDVTEVKSGPALQKAEGSELVAVMRRNGALAEDYAKRHGIAAWYNNAEALVNDPNVNAIYVATPPRFSSGICPTGCPGGEACLCGKTNGEESCRMFGNDSCLRRSEGTFIRGLLSQRLAEIC